MNGLKKACNYIDGGNRVPDPVEISQWFMYLGGVVYPTNSGEGVFYVETSAIAWDLTKPSNFLKKSTFLSKSQSLDKEIFTMVNNLLYPGGEDLPTDKSFFEELLCSAPCQGPCIKQEGYADNGTNPNWPDFDCPNTPNWLGQRWEGGPNNTDWHWTSENRQLNGLDYMALYNIYMLQYPSEQTPYYNPQHAEGKYVGAGKITGPNVLCPVNIGNYKVLESYPAGETNGIQNLVWTTTSNLEVLNAQNDEANIRANTSLTPSSISVDLEEKRLVQQQFFGAPYPVKWKKKSSFVPLPFNPDLTGILYVLTSDPVPTSTIEEIARITKTPINKVAIYFDQIKDGPEFEKIEDICDISYSKPISTGKPVDMETLVDPCHSSESCYARAVGFVTDVQLNWTISNSNGTKTGTDQEIGFCDLLDTEHGGIVHIMLDVFSPTCGHYNLHVTKEYDACDGDIQRLVVINPNPAQNGINVSVYNAPNDPYLIPNGGMNVQISPSYGGSVQISTQLYSNGQSINVSSLPNGVYNLRVSSSNYLPTSANFIIAR